MKLMQRLEFWVLSVSALIISIGANAHYVALRVLLVFPFCFMLNPVFRFGKKLPVELLDGPCERACRTGMWPRGNRSD